jgi:hypothetical protein
MRITNNQPDLLIAEERSWQLGAAMIALIVVFIGVGLSMISIGEWVGLLVAVIGGGLGFLAFYVFVQRVQVVFFRPDGWVEIRRRSFGGGTKVRHRLDEISRAVVESTQSKSGTLYRVALEIDRGESAGRHSLLDFYTNAGDPHGVAVAINHWLATARHRA